MMTKSSLFLAALCASAALLPACAGDESRNGASGMLPHGTSAVMRSHRPTRSWMDGGVSKQDLLYVSNADAEVTVYRYWKHELVGILTTFTQPMGECVDASQNVYIADYAARKVIEYAHGGKKPIATFDDSPDSPYSCSVDPSTGDLAAANDDGNSNGNVAIWRAASGKRTTYTDSKLGDVESCAYDDRGNLLASNGDVQYPYTTYFAWLPKGGSKLLDIAVPGPEPSWTWRYVQGIQWDGKYYALDANFEIFRENLVHGQIYYVGETVTQGQDQFNIGPFGFYNATKGGQATQVVDGVISDPSSPAVDYWDYPAGGDPVATITHGLDRPFGVVVSLKKQ